MKNFRSFCSAAVFANLCFLPLGVQVVSAQCTSPQPVECRPPRAECFSEEFKASIPGLEQVGLDVYGKYKKVWRDMLAWEYNNQCPPGCDEHRTRIGPDIDFKRDVPWSQPSECSSKNETHEFTSRGFSPWIGGRSCDLAALLAAKDLANYTETKPKEVCGSGCAP